GVRRDRPLAPGRRSHRRGDDRRRARPRVVTKTVTQAVEELVRATVNLSDEDMGREWKWREYDEEGLRFALLMTHHELRDLGVRLAARGRPPTQAQRILAQYHQAYRDLSGVLAGARTEDLDRAPSEGEWPPR